jgi:hypothetical protein
VEGEPLLLPVLVSLIRASFGEFCAGSYFGKRGFLLALTSVYFIFGIISGRIGFSIRNNIASSVHRFPSFEFSVHNPVVFASAF